MTGDVLAEDKQGGTVKRMLCPCGLARAFILLIFKMEV